MVIGEREGGGGRGNCILTMISSYIYIYSYLEKSRYPGSRIPSFGPKNDAKRPKTTQKGEKRRKNTGKMSPKK